MIQDQDACTTQLENTLDPGWPSSAQKMFASPSLPYRMVYMLLPYWSIKNSCSHPPRMPYSMPYTKNAIQRMPYVWHSFDIRMAFVWHTWRMAFLVYGILYGILYGNQRKTNSHSIQINQTRPYLLRKTNCFDCKRSDCASKSSGKTRVQ